VSESAPPGGQITWLFTRLNRYADELPDDYREQADPDLAQAIADSFRQHIEGYIAERDARMSLVEGKSDCPTVELQAEDGAEVTIKFYGDEAFDLQYIEPGGRVTDEGNFRIGTTWTHLDRSGLSFLAHMFVEEGRIDVPEPPETREDAGT
jgi:hypothetical protein